MGVNTYWGSCTWSYTRIQCINVETQVNRSVAVRVDVVERHLHDFANSILVYLMHAKRLDSVLPHYTLLAHVGISNADVHDLVGFKDPGFDP